MEHLNFQFTGGAPTGHRAYTGVVGSGDPKVLLTPGKAGHIDVVITTPINGMSAMWQTQLARVSGSHAWPAAKIIISDFGVTPTVVWLRLEQALEAFNALTQSWGETISCNPTKRDSFIERDTH